MTGTGSVPPSTFLGEAAARRRLIALSVAFTVHAAWLAVVAEDAYITFRFARNLARGHGLVWNPGEPPVEGFTNPLWTLLAAVAERTALSVPLTMQLVGVVAGLAILWVVDRFAARVLELEGTARALPTLLLAASGPLATWSASGLETPLFTLLVLVGFYRLALWQRRRERRDLTACWVTVALATLTRPEGWLLAAIVAWQTLVAPPPDQRRRTWALVAAFTLFSVALTVGRLAYFGAPLPNTFYAKTGGSGEQIVRGTVYLGFFAFHYLLPLVPLVALGLSRERAPDTAPVREVVRTLVAWSAGYTLYVIAVGGDYMAMYRFLVPVLPALGLLVALACGELFLSTRRTPAPRVRWAGGVLVVLTLAWTLVHSTPLERELFDKPPRQHGTWRGVETERWHVRRLERLARYFEERAAGRRRASVATRAIGLLGYKTELAVYDFHGVVDARIARRGRADRPIGSGLPGHEKSDYQHILTKRPTWWMFTRTLRDGPARWPAYDEQTDRILRRDYRLVTVDIEDPHNRESGSFSFLERRGRKRPGGRRSSPRGSESPVVPATGTSERDATP